MVPGTILFDPQFRFHDGKKGPKLFVVLNDGREGHYVCVKTTSQDARYGLVYGCQITANYPYFYLPLGTCFLTEHTWLCLGEFYDLDAADLHAAIVNDRIKRIGVLEVPLTREIQACCTNSFDILNAQATSILVVWKETTPKP